MHTTNTASAGNPSTYLTLKEDCEQLAAIARKIAALASMGDGFRDDPDFATLKAEFSTALDGVNSLAITL